MNISPTIYDPIDFTPYNLVNGIRVNKPKK